MICLSSGLSVLRRSESTLCHYNISFIMQNCQKMYRMNTIVQREQLKYANASYLRRPTFLEYPDISQRCRKPD